MKANDKILSDIFASIQDGVCVLDKELNILRINPALEKMHPELRVVGEKCYEIYQGKKSPCESCPSVKAIKTGQPAYEIIKQEKKGKDAQWFELRSFPMFDSETGRITGAIEYIRDITARIAEEESLQLFTNLLNKSPDAIFVADPATGRFLMVNDKGCSNLGYDRKKLLTLRTLDVEEVFRDQSVWDAHVKEVKSKGSMIMEGVSKRYDGTLFPVEINSSYIALDKKDYLVAVVRDITRRKKAEEALQEQEERFRAIFNSVNEAIFVHDIENGKILDVNERVCEMYGYTYEEALWLDVESLSSGEPPYDQKHALKWLEKAAKGKPQQFEWHCKAKSGRLFWGEVNIRLATIGRNKRLLVAVRDISERKELEERKANFYAMISHDFKSPLTVILGFSELLLDEKFQLDAKEREVVVSIRNSSDRLMRLVDEFLSISKLEARDFKLHPVLSDISQNLMDAYASFEMVLKKKELTFSVEMAEDLPNILMDQRLVQRAVVNLIQNAVNHTPVGGRITLKAEKDGDFIVVSVSDTGLGIPKEEQGRIFEKYYRSRRTSYIKGTGLGLAIVKAVMDAHGGRVEVASEVSKGSTFSLFFPVAN
jgi:two-component system, cell cycle sensor histidine kinase and response regulator CckA